MCRYRCSPCNEVNLRKRTGSTICKSYSAEALKCSGGTAVFRGTRVPFQALLDYLEGGQTLNEFRDDFPTVTREAAISSLELAKSLVDWPAWMKILIEECHSSKAHRISFPRP